MSAGGGKREEPPGVEEEEPPTQHGEPPRYWLEYRGHRFELRPGDFVLGRSAGCQIVLDDALVSRRHALITVHERGVKIEDLGSANGMMLNGERVVGTRNLTVGDRIVIGQQELVLRAGAPARHRLEEKRHLAATLSGVEAETVLRAAGMQAAEADVDSTHQAHTLALLGGVANKVLALGRGEEAERLLGPMLKNLLEQARQGRMAERETADLAVVYAIKIAAVTTKAKWIDYSIELFTLLGRPLPAEVVDQLYSLLRTIRGVSVNGLRLYEAALRANQERMGPNERFLVQRIEGLTRLATR